MAFAAQTGAVPRLAWLLWLAVVIWAVVYDTMYAMADREDDLRIGVRSTAILFGKADLFFIVLLQDFPAGVAAAGRPDGATGWLVSGRARYRRVADALANQRRIIRHRDPQACFRAFLNNQWVGAAVFAGILLDYTFSAGVSDDPAPLTRPPASFAPGCAQRQCQRAGRAARRHHVVHDHATLQIVERVATTAKARTGFARRAAPLRVEFAPACCAGAGRSARAAGHCQCAWTAARKSRPPG